MSVDVCLVGAEERLFPPGWEPGDSAPYVFVGRLIPRNGVETILGTSEKAQRVIPGKAYQALACATPLLTADTPAARELLVDGESALLVPPGDAGELARALRRLARDPVLARRLSEGGRAAYREHASEAVLGARWREVLERAVERRAERGRATAWARARS